MNVSVILPTYNELGNILPLIETIQKVLDEAAISHQVVVVDDNSPDGTAQGVRDRFQGDERVRLFVRTEERGLASAIAYGIRQAEGDVVVVMDTDFNHDPIMLPQMVKFLEFYDIIIGSRFTMGGGMEERWRYYASFVFNFFVRQILRTQIADNLCGFFSMKREKLLEMDLDQVFRGYGEYFMHFLYLAWRKSYRLLEVPTYYRIRTYGESKSRFVRMLLSYTWTALQVRLGRR